MPRYHWNDTSLRVTDRHCSHPCSEGVDPPVRGEGSRDPPPIPSLSPFTFLYSHGFHFSTPSPPQVLSQPLGPRLPDPGDCGEHLCFKMPLMFLLLSCIPRERPLHLPAWVGGRGRPLGVDLLVHTSPISSCQLCLYFHSFGPRFRLPEPLSSFSLKRSPTFHLKVRNATWHP